MALAAASHRPWTLRLLRQRVQASAAAQQCFLQKRLVVCSGSGPTPTLAQQHRQQVGSKLRLGLVTATYPVWRRHRANLVCLHLFTLRSSQLLSSCDAVVCMSFLANTRCIMLP